MSVKRKRSSLGSKRKTSSGRWQIRVSCGYKRDGSPRRISKTVDTEREADLLLAKLHAEMTRDRTIGDMLTVSEYYHEHFVPGREGNVTRATMADYDCQWRNHIEPEFGWRALSDVHYRDVQAWAMTMTRSAAEHSVRTLRAILRDAWLNDYLVDEPMRKPIKYPRAVRKPSVMWNAHQVATAMGAMRGCTLEGLWLLMVGGGLSRSEAAAVTWGDIVFAISQAVTASVTVDKARTSMDGLKPTKNEFRDRIVAIGEPFASRLYELRADPVELVFPGNVDNIWKSWHLMFETSPETKHGVRTPWHGCLARAGLPYMPIGRMRAVHETMMHQVVSDNALIARQHGRSNIETGYKHYYEPDTSGTAQKLAGLF